MTFLYIQCVRTISFSSSFCIVDFSIWKLGTSIFVYNKTGWINNRFLQYRYVCLLKIEVTVRQSTVYPVQGNQIFQVRVHLSGK